MRIESDGIGLHVEVDGPPDGTPVVFLHGVSGSGRTYDWLPAQVTDGRRIVRIDFRGHGRSDRAPGTYLIDRYGADVVAAVREVADRPAVLVGHSLGAVAAWWVAQQHPELVAAALLEEPPLWHLAAAPFGPDPSRTLGDVMTEDALAARAEALLRMDPGVLDAAVDRSTLADTDTSSPVGVAVLVVAADDTMGAAFPTRHAERLAQTHPAVEVARVRGSGHAIHDEREHRSDYLEHLVRLLAEHA